MRIYKFIAAAMLMLAGLSATAQNGTMTPYSSYGYGILGDYATSSQRAMGGVGYAMNSGRQINVMNPASYAAIDSLTFLFDLGMSVTNMWQKEKQDGTELSDSRFGGGLSYVTMQWPIGRYMGMSVGLVPYSSVGYAFGNKIEHGIDSREGYGGLNELYLGLAGRIINGLSIGGHVSYLFGTTLNNTYAMATAGYSTVYQKQIEVRDYHLNFGLQYTLPLANGDVVTAGVTYSPAKTLLGHARLIYYANQDQSQPTIEDEHKLKGNYSLPETWGAGINYRLGRSLMFEADYTYQPWSKVKYMGFTNEQIKHNYANRSKYAVGMQFTPNFRGGYFKRVNYRLGAYYCDDYLIVRNNKVREYGVTAGCGFPVPVFKTLINVSLEWKHRQANPNPLIKENYVMINFGVNFNELWFRQSKIY